MFAGWLLKIAIASVLLLTLSWAAVPGNRRNAQAVEVSRIEPMPIPLMPDPPGPADQSPSRVGSSVPQIRGLNPWVNDPDRIQSGRQIPMPSATAIGADAPQQATQSKGAVPTEVGKQ